MMKKNWMKYAGATFGICFALGFAPSTTGAEELDLGKSILTSFNQSVDTNGTVNSNAGNVEGNTSVVGTVTGDLTNNGVSHAGKGGVDHSVSFNGTEKATGSVSAATSMSSKSEISTVEVTKAVSAAKAKVTDVKDMVKEKIGTTASSVGATVESTVNVTTAVNSEGFSASVEHGVTENTKAELFSEATSKASNLHGKVEYLASDVKAGIETAGRSELNTLVQMDVAGDFSVTGEQSDASLALTGKGVGELSSKRQFQASADADVTGEFVVDSEVTWNLESFASTSSAFTGDMKLVSTNSVSAATETPGFTFDAQSDFAGNFTTDNGIENFSVRTPEVSAYGNAEATFEGSVSESYFEGNGSFEGSATFTDEADFQSNVDASTSAAFQSNMNTTTHKEVATIESDVQATSEA